MLDSRKTSKISCCCLPPNVKGEWVDSNFQIIDLLVPPRAAGVAGTERRIAGNFLV